MKEEPLCVLNAPSNRIQMQMKLKDVVECRGPMCDQRHHLLLNHTCNGPEKIFFMTHLMEVMEKCHHCCDPKIFEEGANMVREI